MPLRYDDRPSKSCGRHRKQTRRSIRCRYRATQGVEPREQADFLRVHACDEIQGFYFNRPMSAYQCTELLQEQNTGVTLATSDA
jgi:predicted signal transduction protein with EAL and GGDEF domain